MTGETPVIPELNRRRLLRGGLAAGAGLAVAGLGTVGLTRVAEAVTFDTQFYWAYCTNCASNNGTDGTCPAGDFAGPHATGGLAYSVLYNDAVSGSSQGNWWWCGLCQGLFYGVGGVGGYCPGTNGETDHYAGQTDPTIKSLAYDVSYYSTSSP
jgi:hypothetical protein